MKQPHPCHALAACLIAGAMTHYIKASYCPCEEHRERQHESAQKALEAGRAYLSLAGPQGLRDVLQDIKLIVDHDLRRIGAPPPGLN